MGIPNSFVNNSVSAISGDFIESEIDIVVGGPEPLIYGRYYSSACKNKWFFGPGLRMDVHAEDNLGITAKVIDASGEGLNYFYEHYYRKTDNNVILKLDPELIKYGLTNAGEGYINGRTNPKSTQISISLASKEYSLKNGSGEVLKYEVIADKWESKKRKRDTTGRLSTEIKPNGNRIKYTYAPKIPEGSVDIVTQNLHVREHLNAIDATNENGHVCYASLDFKKNKTAKSRCVSASDGRQVQYNFCDAPGKSSSLILSEVIRPDAPRVKYSYTDISFTKELPDERKEITEFYHDEKNDVGGTVVKIKAYKLDRRVGRVRLQKAPVGTTSTPLITYRFFYEIRYEDYVPLDGYTDVFNALGYKTRYTYTKEQRLNKIHFYDQNGNVHSSQHMAWGASETPDAGNLTYYSFADQNESVIHYTTHKYDHRGNIIQKISFGNQTGYGGFEAYSHDYTFSNDGFNLLLKETEGSGKTITYAYLANSNLASAKFVLDHEQIVEREFYDYDENQVEIRKIVDDGSSYDRSDLTGVTARQIIEISPKQNAPCLGLPEIMTTSAVDVATGEQIVLKKAIMKYSREGYVLLHELYDANDSLISYTEYTRDAMGNAIQERNILGHVIRREFDANGNKTLEAGPGIGSIKKYVYDFSNRLIRENIFCDGKVLSKTYSYDLCSRMTTSTDYSGHVTYYEYDAFGNCTKMVLPVDHDLSGNAFTPVILKTYDCMGNLTSVTDPNGYTTSTQYNVLGQPIAISHPDGTTESFRYTQDGQLAFYLAKNGTKTFYTRDCLGRLLKEEVFAGETLLTSKTNIYNRSKLVGSLDAEGNESHYTYDFAGRISSIETGDSVKKITYDAAGRQSHIILGNDSTAIVTVQEYDLLNRVIEERIEDAYGNIQKLQQYLYDEANNQIMIVSETQAGTAITSTEYNTLHKPIRITDPLGHVAYITYDYNACSKWGTNSSLKTTLIDSLGQQTISFEDSPGRISLIEKRDPYGNLISKSQNFFDAVGNRTEMMDTILTPGKKPRITIAKFSYGPSSRLERLIEAYDEPLQKTTSYLFDNCGNHAAVVKPDGVILNYSYDALGRLAHYCSSDKSIDYTYAYDRNSNLLEVQDKNTNKVTKRVYDVQGRIVSEVLANGLEIKQHYDDVGRPFEVVLPDDSLIRHIYNGSLLRAVTRVTALGEEKYTHRYLDYDLSGHLLASDSVGGGRLEMKYDLAGRLTNYTAPHYTFKVDGEGYDAGNNLKYYSITDSEGQTPCRIKYDALYQLKAESGTAQHTYEHDSIHNRVKKDGVDSVLNCLNQLTSDGTRDYHYDFNGNLIERSQGNDSVKYQYDALDRLISVQMSDKVIKYSYDSFNRRLDKRVLNLNGDLLHYQDFIYDGINEIGSSDSSGNIIELRVLGAGKGAEIGAAIAIELRDQLYVPIHNERGDVAALLNPDHEAVEWYRYTAFGEETIYGNGNGLNPWRFSSKRVDPDTGFIGFGRREYDPSIGRWITPDPAGYVDGPNVYAYVLNNPLTLFDLYGLHIDYNSPCAHLQSTKYPVLFDKDCVGDAGRPNRKEGKEKLWEFERKEKEQKQFKDEETKVNVSKYTGNFSAEEKKCSRNLVVNPGNAVAGNAIVYLNGIYTTLEEAIAAALDISESHGNCEVTLSYNATHGILGDLAEAFVSLFGFATHASTIAVEALSNACESAGPNGKVSVIGFSQGIITADVAIGSLSVDQKKQLQVTGLGGGTTISSKHGVKVTHYISTGDPVAQFLTFFDRFRNSNVVLLPAVNKWNDHSFFDSAYGEVLKEKGSLFASKHGRFTKK
jgi:RHS repeat-associated protein